MWRTIYDTVDSSEERAPGFIMEHNDDTRVWKFVRVDFRLASWKEQRKKSDDNKFIFQPDLPQ